MDVFRIRQPVEHLMHGAVTAHGDDLLLAPARQLARDLLRLAVSVRLVYRIRHVQRAQLAFDRRACALRPALARDGIVNEVIHAILSVSGIIRMRFFLRFAMAGLAYVLISIRVGMKAPPYCFVRRCARSRLSRHTRSNHKSRSGNGRAGRYSLTPSCV